MVHIQLTAEPVTESWTVKQVATQRVPFSWEKVFAAAKHELKDISETIEEEEKTEKILPLKKDLFMAFQYTSLEKVKVVIVGQDPYPQTVIIRGKEVPRATGLSFSTHPEDEIPSSLVTIYEELRNSIMGFEIPNHGDLRSWAYQGVLMLNSSLTLRRRSESKDKGNENSHAGLWLGFVKRVIDAIAAVNPNCIYVLWGAEAQKRIEPLLSRSNIILRAGHPSARNATTPFAGCKHFSKINEVLLGQGRAPIDWTITPITKSSSKKIKVASFPPPITVPPGPVIGLGGVTTNPIFGTIPATAPLPGTGGPVTVSGVPFVFSSAPVPAPVSSNSSSSLASTPVPSYSFSPPFSTIPPLAPVPTSVINNSVAAPTVPQSAASFSGQAIQPPLPFAANGNLFSSTNRANLSSPPTAPQSNMFAPSSIPNIPQVFQGAYQGK